MATKMLCTIDLLALPETTVKVLPDEDGVATEYVCIPTKEAGIQRWKTRANLKFVVEPLNVPLINQTHYLKPIWVDKFKTQMYAKGIYPPLIGRAVIKFVFKEQKKLDPMNLSNISFDGDSE